MDKRLDDAMQGYMNHQYSDHESRERHRRELAAVVAYLIGGSDQDRERALYALLCAVEFKVRVGVR